MYIIFCEKCQKQLTMDTLIHECNEDNETNEELRLKIIKQYKEIKYNINIINQNGN